MAQSKVSLTTCSICLEKFKIPKTLPCLHTFCEECITKYISSILSTDKATNGKFNCPICRHLVELPDGVEEERWGKILPLNHLMLSIMECESISDVKVCNSCERGNESQNATQWCVECRDALCDKCADMHKRYRNSINHKIIKITDLAEADLKTSDELFCHKHRDRKVEAFCSDHRDLCCITCVTIEHRKCLEVNTIETAAENIRKSDILNDLERTFSSMEETLNKLRMKKEENINDVKTSCQEITSDIIQQRIEINKYLDNIQEKTIQQLSVAEKSVLPELETSRDELKSKISITTNSLNILRKGMKYATDAQLLSEIEKIRRQKIHLEDFLSNLSETISSIQFESSNVLGQLQSRFKELGQIRQRKISSSESQDLPLLPDAVAEVCSFDTGSTFIYGGKILDDGKILICNRETDCIELYNQNGEILSSLKCPNHLRDVDVYETIVGDFWRGVATVEGKTLLFFVIRDDYELVESHRKCLTHNCFGVRYWKDNIVVACSSVIKVLDTDGDLIKSVFPLSSQARYLDIKQDDDLICFSSEFYSTITCIRPDGTEMFRHVFDTEISGVSFDHKGNILLIGHKTGSILRLDYSGNVTTLFERNSSECNLLRFQIGKPSKCLANIGSRVFEYTLQG